MFPEADEAEILSKCHDFPQHPISTFPFPLTLACFTSPTCHLMFSVNLSGSAFFTPHSVNVPHITQSYYLKNPDVNLTSALGVPVLQCFSVLQTNSNISCQQTLHFSLHFQTFLCLPFIEVTGSEIQKLSHGPVVEVELSEHRSSTTTW